VLTEYVALVLYGVCGSARDRGPYVLARVTAALLMCSGTRTAAARIDLTLRWYPS